MAITVSCTDPDALLRKIRAAIREEKVKTWLLDKDGDFTHSPDQWKWKAWLTPQATETELIFYILGQKSKKMSSVVYAVYHGRLIEMLLTHFDADIKNATASAFPIGNDRLGGSGVTPPSTVSRAS
jgi:hypothetical protein